MPSSVTSPEKFYGFKPGEDRKLARWDKIVKYFQRLDGESDRIKVVNLGETTEGNPFILAYISSKENLTDLDRYKEMSWKIGHPRGARAPTHCSASFSYFFPFSERVSRNNGV